jgi:hypothetical protein
MKTLKYLIIFTLSLFVFSGCSTDEDGTSELNYASFGSNSYDTGVDVDGTATVDITVYTTKVNSSDRAIDVAVDLDKTNADPLSYSVPASVIIKGGTNEGVLTVNLSDVNLGIGVSKIVIDFVGKSGLYNGDETIVNYSQNCNEVTATLDINFDYYASETSWDIFDSLGGVVLSGEGYSDGQAPASLELALCAGRDYTLVFYDAYGDGMNDGTNLGSYMLTIGGEVKVTGGGNFGASESNEFDTK